jgi:ABC-2 type transport system permease protein
MIPPAPNPSASPAPPRLRGPLASAARVLELAVQTVRQLARMKVFYFLVFFALLVIGSTLFVLRYNSFEQELKLLKDFSFFGMTLFSALLAIVGTAMLLPRDVEDRTLYTILSKPVPRIEYLLGKWLGVVMLVGISLLLMNLFFSGVLYLRQSWMIAAEEAAFRAGGGGRDAGEALALVRATVAANGLTWSLQAAVLAVFLKAVVIASMALMISTFAQSSLFTMVTAAVAYFAGHLQADMREFYESMPATAGLAKALAGPMAVLFPDFQLFNVVDAAVAGEPIGAGVVARLALFGAGYAVVYLSVAWYVFHDKEI